MQASTGLLADYRNKIDSIEKLLAKIKQISSTLRYSGVVNPIPPRKGSIAPPSSKSKPNTPTNSLSILADNTTLKYEEKKR
jgi:hypothetical protein